MKKVRVISLAGGMPTGPLLHPNQILSNYLKQHESYGLHNIFASWKITTKDSESCPLLGTRLLVLLFIPTKYDQNISKGIKVMACTRVCLQTDGQMH